MSNSQIKLATSGQAANGGNSRLNYSVFINTVKSMSIIERLYWLAILLCLIGGAL